MKTSRQGCRVDMEPCVWVPAFHCEATALNGMAFSVLGRLPSVERLLLLLLRVSPTTCPPLASIGKWSCEEGYIPIKYGRDGRF